MRLRTIVSAVSIVFTVWSALFACPTGRQGRGRMFDEGGEPAVTPANAGKNHTYYNPDHLAAINCAAYSMTH